MFKILLIAGHGEEDPGACANGHCEAELTRQLVPIIRDAAVRQGIFADIHDTGANAYKKLLRGEYIPFEEYNYVLEVHFNASSNLSAHGSMIYISNRESGHGVEDAILQQLYKIGALKCWDGVVIAQRQWPKTGLYLQERCLDAGVSHALLETCFISNVNDMSWYQSHKQQIADAVVMGIINGFHLQGSTAQIESDTGEPWYRVRKVWQDDGSQIGAFHSIEKAKSLANENPGYAVFDENGSQVYPEDPVRCLKPPFMVKVLDDTLNIRSGPGTNHHVVGVIRDHGSYTIVGTATGAGAAIWGQLKSGSGYIAIGSGLTTLPE